MNTRRVLPIIAIGAICALTGCSKGGDSKTGDPKRQPSSGTGGKAAPGAEGFEGSIVTSGLYAATWTAHPEAPPDPLNSRGNLNLTSDKQTFGYVGVDKDGTIKFGSGASELSGPGPFTGSGARVTLDSSGMYVCAFTVDADVVGKPDGPTLHLSGTMTAHWHPEGRGGANCP